MAKSFNRPLTWKREEGERIFTAEAQRGKRGDEEEKEETQHRGRRQGEAERELNTKAQGHKGQRGREETFSRKERRGIKNQSPDFSFI